MKNEYNIGYLLMPVEDFAVQEKFQNIGAPVDRGLGPVDRGLDPVDWTWCSFRKPTCFRYFPLGLRLGMFLGGYLGPKIVGLPL